MKIVVAANVSNEPRWFPILDVVLLVVEDGKHLFSDDELDVLLACAWVLNRGADVRDLIRLTTTSGSLDSNGNAHKVVIDAQSRRGGETSQDGTRTFVHPLDAVVFLSTPFQLIVENELFDGSFLLWMAKGLGYTKLISAYQQHRFTFRHAGGKDSIVRSAKVFSESVWPRPNRTTDRAFRRWLGVVLDNDARDSGDDPNRGIIEGAELHVAFVHQLQRRSIESYLSQQHMQRLDSSPLFQRRVSALFRMSDEQRRYYHMKRGFRFQRDVIPTKPNFMAANEVTAGQKALYATVNEADWTLLMDGFGRGLASVFADPGSRPNTNDPNITTPASRAELLNLFRSIYESM